MLDPELIARGLDRYDAAHPRLRENLRLPKWDRSSEIAYPPNALDEWNRRAMQVAEATTQRLKEKHALSASADWASARDIQSERDEAEFARRDAELQARAAADKADYETKLKQTGR